jgi:hypothetical protein
MQPTTAAGALINALAPRERAVLFCSLEIYNSMMEENLYHSQFETTQGPAIKEFAKKMCLWNTSIVKNIKEKLFAECFPEDLSVEAHMYQDFKNSKEAVVSLD